MKRVQLPFGRENERGREGEVIAEGTDVDPALCR
jgi:hypothetical protein